VEQAGEGKWPDFAKFAKHGEPAFPFIPPVRSGSSQREIQSFRHCEEHSDEAIQKLCGKSLDCFAVRFATGSQ